MAGLPTATERRDRHLRALRDIRAGVEIDLITVQEQALSAQRAMASAAAEVAAERIVDLVWKLEALDVARHLIEVAPLEGPSERLLCQLSASGPRE